MVFSEVRPNFVFPIFLLASLRAIHPLLARGYARLLTVTTSELNPEMTIPLLARATTIALSYPFTLRQMINSSTREVWLAVPCLPSTSAPPLPYRPAR